jgi:aspergillopepsin I
MVDNTLYTGSIAYAPVDSSQGLWGFTASNYGIGSSFIANTSISGIADTGTTLLLLDPSIVSTYYKQVPGAQNSASYGGYIFNCSATLPDFKFSIGSVTLTIPGTYINDGPLDNSSTNCFGGIQNSGPSPLNIFGDVALKAAFVVFDSGNKRIGFATKTL